MALQLEQALEDTPFKLPSARISQTNTQNLAQNRDRHMHSAQDHTRASPMTSWYKAYAKEWKLVQGADMDRVVDHLVKAKHLSVGKEGEWAAVPRKRRDGTNENTHFAGMETIWESVLTAAEEVLPDRFSRDNRTLKFSCRPNNETYSEVMGGSARVDAISQLCQSSYPANTQYALPGSARKASLRYNTEAATAGDDADLGQQSVVFTADVAVSYEWKLEDNAESIANVRPRSFTRPRHFFTDMRRSSCRTTRKR